MWCVAELDEQYIGKMEDVLAVYEKPYDATQPVVCLDEKPIALHADVRSPIPAKPGKPAKQDNEYERCGTANVFGVVDKDRAALHHDDTGSFRCRVRSHGRACRQTISLRQDHPLCHG
jgi:hypothetical protein